MPQPVPRLCLWLAFALVFVNYAYFYQGGGPNQFSRFALAAAFAEEGSVCIDNYHQLTIDKSVKDGRYFSDKPPGLALLGAPIYFFLQKVVRPLTNVGDHDWRNWLLYVLTLTTVSVPVALSMTAFFQRAWQQAGGSAALWVTLALALGSPLAVYASLYYSHALCAALLWLSYWLVSSPGKTRASLTFGRCGLAGLLAGWATLSEAPTALITFSILGFVAFAYGFAPRQALAFIVGGLPALGILLAYNMAAFGAPLANGYQYSYLPVFREAMSHGFMGVGWPTGEAFVGVFLGTERGLLFYWPFFIFCVLPAIVLLLVRRRLDPAIILSLVIVVVYFVFACGYYMWNGGMAFGPRHVIPCLPFAAYLAVRSWDILPRFLGPIVTLVSIAIAFMATVTLSEFPESLPLPLVRMALPLFLLGKMSIKFIGPEGRIGVPLPGDQIEVTDPRYFDAANAGELLGLTGLASLLPLILVSVLLAATLWRQVSRDEVGEP